MARALTVARRLLRATREDLAALHKALAAYREFHSNRADHVTLHTVPVGWPRVLTAIGTVESLVYRVGHNSAKVGDDWEHQFGDTGLRRLKIRPVLAYDPNDRDQLYLLGGGYRVNARGIVG